MRLAIGLALLLLMLTHTQAQQRERTDDPVLLRLLRAWGKSEREAARMRAYDPYVPTYVPVPSPQMCTTSCNYLGRYQYCNTSCY